MSKQVADELRDALSSLGPNGEYWMQGAYTDGIRHCASSAVGGPNTMAWKALVNVLPDKCGLVSVWNDAEERTFEDVRLLFEKAIQAEDK